VPDLLTTDEAAAYLRMLRALLRSSPCR